MKQIILFSLCFVTIRAVNAQVVFCPPGAEWHYNFYWYAIRPPVQGWVKIIENEQVKYTGDSLVDSQSVKVLRHKWFFTGSCSSAFYPPTLIKQNGDTVFMRNSMTQHSWQILYNFAATPGDSWNATIGDVLYTTVVDSVGYVSVNNFTLKRLFVTCDNGTGFWMPQSTITERLGSSRFLFNFFRADCDGPANYEKNLCYRDDVFGLKKFTSLACDYFSNGGVGIEEENLFVNSLNIYPNPVSKLLNVDIKHDPGPFTVSLKDLRGKLIEEKECSGNSFIDVSAFQDGLYMLDVYKKGLYVGTKKIAVINNN